MSFEPRKPPQYVVQAFGKGCMIDNSDWVHVSDGGCGGHCGWVLQA